jgi:O-acetyl-ADP-ribose deacetylase (regulator of RNase III)
MNILNINNLPIFLQKPVGFASIWAGRVVTLAVSNPGLTLLICAVVATAIAIFVYKMYFSAASPKTFKLQTPPVDIPVSTSDFNFEGVLFAIEKSKIKLEDKEHQTELKFSFDNASNFRLCVRRQNMFESGADTIVNAANTHLGGGGGIDYQIHTNGGATYVAAQKALQKKYDSKYVSGHAAMITSGDLSNKGIKNVIVVAGPDARDPKDFSKALTPTIEMMDQLYSCYLNSLLLAESQKVKHLALPSISTGIFRFNSGFAANIALKACYDFTIDKSDSKMLVSIHFMPKDPTKKSDSNPLKDYVEALI